MEAYELNTGAKIPAIGFGTWQIPDGHEVFDAVTEALKLGYRLIDTARIYGNERGVGQAVRQSGVAREEIFVTTKLWNDDQGYDSALSAFDHSMERLGLDYIDLYLIHWPASDRRLEAWRGLEQIYRSGRTKAVGVSNYDVGHIKEILENSTLVLAVNQIQLNPFVYQEQAEVLEFCKLHGIVIEAYSPLARGRQMDNKVIAAIAENHKKSNAQVMLRWAIQHGTVPIPKSATPERIKENFEVFDFELSHDEMAKLDNLSG